MPGASPAEVLHNVRPGRFPGSQFPLLAAPSRILSGIVAVFVPDHSCGTAKDFHLLPYYLPFRYPAAGRAPERITNRLYANFYQSKRKKSTINRPITSDAHQERSASRSVSIRCHISSVPSLLSAEKKQRSPFITPSVRAITSACFARSFRDTLSHLVTTSSGGIP